MKRPALDELVYRTLFPRPKPSDPSSFQSLLAQYLVPEVRLETQAFYGSLATQEARYPGLDYSHPPHRLRLARFTWHRRLFRAFDALGLTPHEVAGLTRWEGTRWARERFEREQGVRVRDTTAEEIEVWTEPGVRRRRRVRSHELPEVPAILAEELSDSDEEIQSVGIELNARLRAAVAQREAGAMTAVMDPEWEQWLKDEVERGDVTAAHGMRPRPLQLAEESTPDVIYRRRRPGSSDRQDAPPAPTSGLTPLAQLQQQLMLEDMQRRRDDLNRHYPEFAAMSDSEEDPSPPGPIAVF